MKKVLLLLLLANLALMPFSLIIFLIVPLSLLSQDVPPPPPDGHGHETNQTGGRGAPIGGGLLILLGLGRAYGGFKVYQKKSLLD
jgi:hypothetical protein